MRGYLENVILMLSHAIDAFDFNHSDICTVASCKKRIHVKLRLNATILLQIKYAMALHIIEEK